MPDDELDSQVKLAAEQYIPFDINEVNFDFHVLSTNQQGDDGEQEMALLLVAAKKDKINELSEIVKGAGLTPVVLDVDAFAIENMYSLIQSEDSEDVIALLNVGASVMNVNILKGGTSVFTRDIPIGGNRYTEAIQREMGMTYEEAESTKKKVPAGGVTEEPLATVIEGVNSEVASEVARTIDYFKSSGTDEEVKQVILCGGGAKVSGLAQTLSDRMGIQVEVANPFSELDTSLLEYDGDALADLATEAAVGIGLALRTVGDR
jgi:type IV pilus assembly protein PilM